MQKKKKEVNLHIPFHVIKGRQEITELLTASVCKFCFRSKLHLIDNHLTYIFKINRTLVASSCLLQWISSLLHKDDLPGNNSTNIEACHLHKNKCTLSSPSTLAESNAKGLNT